LVQVAQLEVDKALAAMDLVLYLVQSLQSVVVVAVLMVINLGEVVDPEVVTLSMEEQAVLERPDKVTLAEPGMLPVAVVQVLSVQELAVVTEFNHLYQVLLHTMQVAVEAGAVVE
jgi:uncharacterized membrane protein